MLTLFRAVLNWVLLTINYNDDLLFLIPCEQWFLQAGRYTTGGEKLLQVTVCFSIEDVHPRDACVKNIK